ncbi:MAG: hypothetical protein IKK32_05765 [Oscillospiraceae bacterium]|nr:hypothetical protein [Oscillospiraceae bacterium]MBR4093360.1 hypothetical protein [Oscillospiraceae bacterium]
MKIIREKITILALGSLALLSLATMTISVMTDNDNTETKVINAETVITEKRYYILKEYNGKIASFYYDDERPIDVFDVSVNSFGEYDKQALYKGIIADSEEELNRLIEDYTS